MFLGVFFGMTFSRTLGYLCIGTLMLLSQASAQQRPEIVRGPRSSTEAEAGFSPCLDTVKILMFKKKVDLGVLLPAWLPVENYNHIAVLEGAVIPQPNSKHIDTHVSPGDFPYHHYTHDLTFNVKPDVTPDSRYTNLLAFSVVRSEKNGVVSADTILKEYVHVEWETGLGANNDGNICAELNKQGKSCGFYSSGHERKDVIWNWPTLGDWVHVEGLWLWDRGHPPARTEIHPARLIAVRRNIPVFMKLKGRQWGYATRVDVYASGDGGALNNNRAEAPEYVQKVKMSDKDYKFRVNQILPRPSNNSKLMYRIDSRKGDTYSGKVSVVSYPVGDVNPNDAFVEISIPWRNLPDTDVFARTIFVYWDEAEGLAAGAVMNKYKVSVKSLRFRHRKEFISKAEYRLFLEVGGDWLFLNDFADAEDILDDGIGKTRKRNIKIDQEFTVYLPEGKEFRVHAGGWEADGVNDIFGRLMDQYAPCNAETRRWIMDNLDVISPLKLKGCMDDHIGEVHAMHSAADIGEGKSYAMKSDGRKEKEICPCESGRQKNIFVLKYTIEPVTN